MEPRAEQQMERQSGRLKELSASSKSISMSQSTQGDPYTDRITQVVNYFCALIEDGTLHPGNKIPSEQQCREALKISRAGLRMGIGCLTAMGVVEVRPGKGFFIADGPPEFGLLPFGVMSALYGFHLQEMYEARSIIESHLAELAAQRANEEHHNAMAEEVAEMYAAAESPADYLNHHIRFHRMIGKASGNPILAALVETLTTFLYTELQKMVERSHSLRESAGLHKEIYKAIRRRQPLEARRIMERHLRLMEDAKDLDLTAS
jgi:GntR family transcriptional regulator, transcriptional repressor for pyruvate dehydrogenase complex